MRCNLALKRMPHHVSSWSAKGRACKARCEKATSTEALDVTVSVMAAKLALQIDTENLTENLVVAVAGKIEKN